MNWQREWPSAALLVGGFLAFVFLPLEGSGLPAIVLEPLALAKWYAREHVVFCLVPAFFIAGGISVFVSGASVMRYLGSEANKFVAYGVASVSGTILAVCSCTVLPLFAGIYRMGAGLGPASAFLYSGPAINVLAIVLTARVLGPEFGLARAICAIVFSIAVGIAMHAIFRRSEGKRPPAAMSAGAAESPRALWKTAIHFGTMVGILVFANWGRPAEAGGLWHAVYSVKWHLTAAFAVGLAVALSAWFGLEPWKVALAGLPAAGLAAAVPGHPVIAFAAGAIGLSIATATSPGGSAAAEWFAASWGYAKQIMPLLFAGVLAAGALLGRPGHEALIPHSWVAASVGGNSLGAILFASAAGALMYFATLTEVPVLEGLLGSGMGAGPALALLLAGPALSLPNMLVIRGVMGTKRTAVFVALVVAMATLSGAVFGALYPEVPAPPAAGGG